MRGSHHLRSSLLRSRSPLACCRRSATSAYRHPHAVLLTDHPRVEGRATVRRFRTGRSGGSSGSCLLLSSLDGPGLRPGDDNCAVAGFLVFRQHDRHRRGGVPQACERADCRVAQAGVRQGPASTGPRRPDQRVRTRSLKLLVTAHSPVLAPTGWRRRGPGSAMVRCASAGGPLRFSASSSVMASSITARWVKACEKLPICSLGQRDLLGVRANVIGIGEDLLRRPAGRPGALEPVGFQTRLRTLTCGFRLRVRTR